PEPLFWLHLNVDHPFTLQGILYFPKINLQKPMQEQGIKLYCKQVFVSDSVKNVLPDFLTLLKGAMDSTDIPLNVSRSALQGDPNVKKIANYVIKKVAEGIKKLANSDRERFNKVWEDIGLFVKYGCVSDPKFDELARPFVLFKNSENKLVTLAEYTEAIPEKYKEKMKEKVLTHDLQNGDESRRTQMLSEGVHAISLDQMIDPHFTQHAEMHAQGELKYKFVTIETEIENLLESAPVGADDLKIG
ncbi:MAG: molecular chaperone HtpG, partial [bacterium]